MEIRSLYWKKALVAVYGLLAYGPVEVAASTLVTWRSGVQWNLQVICWDVKNDRVPL